MPYIVKLRRDALDEKRKDAQVPISAGELNYIISKECIRYILEVGGLSYRSFNDVVGVLENVKLEMARRAICVYEDQKISENGDVYQDLLEMINGIQH